MYKESKDNVPDVEKDAARETLSPSPNLPTNSNGEPTLPANASKWQTLKDYNHRFETLTGLESRGISRVPPSERFPVTSTSFLQMGFLWLSADLTANCMTLAMLGPLVFELGFLDAALCSVFGACIGSLGPAYVATWGPRSGHRTMIVARFFMGYVPSKVTGCLTLVIMIGYGTINCIITGQLLSAVNGSGLSLIPGIIIVSTVTLVVAVFGVKAFHAYENYAWAPQVAILFILIGSASPNFNISLPSVGTPHTILANRVSFLGLCISSPLAWSSCAADYFVYHPPTTPKRWIALSTYLSNALAFSFGYLLGVGLATGVSLNPAWATAYSDSQGSLILAGFAPLGRFGHVCGVVLALGTIADNIAATYSAGLVLQVLNEQWLGRVPRWILTVIVCVAYTACAIGGRNSLFEIFQNFLALMGYWTAFFVCVILEEHVLFRSIRRHRAASSAAALRDDDDDGFDWDSWNDSSKLPVGAAALSAFLIGWAGAVVTMKQNWYTGPVARLVGDDGCDLGLWIGSGCTLLTYPVLRLLEVRVLGR
ncbi:hypothetical protein BDV96DRAFT_508292 [Lophiotrema nucula]|uniref:Permease for cytosine/purines, uracil, thiamine, allantoin-domain-containing protein n=1 Tax=Lophiotrema nucula TaxID=690887 RepID=A0A6A5YHJ9_9PLEO|nr:hypothetical protein BDV96DRAFT_508292 [Lophiotrema nucula]